MRRVGGGGGGVGQVGTHVVVSHHGEVLGWGRAVGVANGCVADE